MDAARFLTGQILLAMPGIGDPRFERSVIAMCAHDENGAMGINIGATVPGLGLRRVLGQFEIAAEAAPDAPVHLGGPVEPQRGFVLHSRDWGGEGTVDVAARWAVTSTVDVLRVIAEGRGPRAWVVALGYAGWGEGQLDGELVRHGWFSAPIDAEPLWALPADQRWEAGFRAAGIDPRLLAAETGTA